MKLTTRFFLILLTAAALPFLVFLPRNVQNSRTLVKEAFNAHKDVARSVALEADEWSVRAAKSLEFLCQVGRILEKSPEDLRKLCNAVSANSDVISLNLIDSGGREIYAYNVSSSTAPGVKFSVMSQTALIAKARTSKKLAMGPVMCFDSRIYLPIAYPASSGRVALFRLSMEDMFSKAGSRGIGKTGRILIMDAGGDILPCQKSAEGVQAAALRSVVANKPEVLEHIVIAGEMYAGAAVDAKSLGLTMISLQKEEELYRRQRTSIRWFLGLAAAIFGFTMVMALLISNRIIKPINNMVSVVKKFLKDQHLDNVIPQEGWPEIKGLVSVLNRMMLELQAYRAFQLNQVVEEKNKAKALADTITDGVILVDDHGALIYANRMALQLLGIAKISAEVVIPQSITNPAFLEEFSKFLTSSEKFITVEVESAIPGASPQITKIFRVIANQFLLATLRRPGRVIVMRDITSEKQLEKAKEDFFHMITHDMRAPLATIQGYAEILMRKVQSEELAKYFQSMLYSSRRLRGMIDDILNTAKMEHGTMSLTLESFSVGDIMARIRDNHEPVVTPKKIDFSIQVPQPSPMVYGDMLVIERVLTNLLGNSLKFTPTGGRVMMGCSETETETLFWVEDSGPGIPEDKRKRIFEKFSQMEEHKHMGFGLGLAMCKMAVELHKGRIWVESEVGKYSKFNFTIPKQAPGGPETA